MNRIVTDRVSDYLFAPSADAVTNLRNEGYRDDQITWSGTSWWTRCSPTSTVPSASDVLARDSGSSPGGYGLVTLHRPRTWTSRPCAGRAAVSA